jgi:urease accessory protein
MAGMTVPFVEQGIGLSIIVIGMAAVLGRKMPVSAAMALVGAFAVFHGHAHGSELPEDSSGLAYAAGFLLAMALLHIVGIAAAHLIESRDHPAARVGGAL